MNYKYLSIGLAIVALVLASKKASCTPSVTSTFTPGTPGFLCDPMQNLCWGVDATGMYKCLPCGF